MATKAQYVEAVGTAQEYTAPMRLRIEGLEPVRGEEGVFELHGVRPVDLQLPMDAIEASMVAAHIPRERYLTYMDSFVEQVMVSELAHALAQRTRYA